jgi:DNA-binding transcriptional LysR family regulator
MDRLEAMAMFLTAIDKGSLSAAAREMGVPVPTLSRKVADLESRLGTQLLTRTTRKLTPTEAGVAYAAAARRILEEVQEAEREAVGEFRAPRGELVVTAPLLFGRRHVLPVIADFLTLFPEINVRLVLGDRNADLIEDHIDMAVRIGRLADSGMIATRVGSMRLIVCASPALLSARGEPSRPEDLTHAPCVATDGPLSGSAWRFRSPETGAEVDAAVAPRLVTSAEAVVDAAVLGVGFARLLHYQAYDAIQAGALRLVLESYEPEPAPIHLAHVPRTQMPLKMRRFLDFAAPRLRKSLTMRESSALAQTEQA